MRCCLINDIVESLNRDEKRRFATLRGVEFQLNQGGKVEPYIGNHTIIVPLVGGKALRIYTVKRLYLAEIYGSDYYPQEFDIESQQLDVVVVPWVEGETLGDVVEEASYKIGRGGEQRLESLSRRFDQLALKIIDQEWAHGDLSCDNIVVTHSGELALIDNDSNYTPILRGCASEDLGHAPYQSPRRNLCDFHSRIDDYSIVIISASLAALSVDLDLYHRCRSLDSILLNMSKMNRPYPTLDEVVKALERGGKAAHLSMLRELNNSDIIIDKLPMLLDYIVNGASLGSDDVDIFNEGSYWGYCQKDSNKPLTPAIFDLACPFKGDEAIVAVGREWHKIDREGRVL